MFMQAGFAFLEAGLTRMKNAGHIAGKNVLIFAICSLVYWAVGFGLAFGDGNAIIGTHGLLPDARRAAGDRRGAVRLLRDDPGGAGYLFEVVFAASRSRSSGARWPSARSSGSTSPSASCFTIIYSVISHWIWHAGGWLFGLGMQDFAGSTVVHYQGALAALAGRAPARAADRQVRHRRPGEPDPGPQHALRRARHDHPLVRLVRLQPGLDARVVTGDKLGYFGYVALTTNLAAAAGALGGIVTAWVVLKKPDISMMLNGVIAALVAITAASGFVAPWAAVVIGARRRRDRRRRRALRRADRHRRSDRRGRGARHVGRLGHARDRLLRRSRPGREPGHGHGRPLYTRQLPPARHPGARPRHGRRVHV